jgi:predicted AlkP superfamily phosphohydrolase/phosphomutase
MKMLIYGIDGGDLEIMKTFDMPFVHQFLEDNTNVDLTVDLYNRGWVEILTGKEGKDTRGFYMSPVLDGSHRCATKFSMKELENDPDVVPLWKLAEQKGVKYCIMNVPTTTPVPKTKNGIVVGSAGGGLNKISGIPEMLVSDEKTRKFLEEKNYIVDIRIPNEDIEKTEELFRKLMKMEDIRTDCFVELCKDEEIEFGFLANRGTTIVQYLARSEIESYTALKEMSEFMPVGGEKSWAHESLEEHYTALDENIRKLYNELQPDHFIITADHNTVPAKYKASVTPFLLEQGYLQKKSSGRASAINGFKSLIKKYGVSKQIGAVTKRLTPVMHDALREYDWDKSVAFGSAYIAGIFINDKERFGGSVSDVDAPELILEICESFNSLDEKRRKGMVAKPFRSKIEECKYIDFFPDIILEGAEGVFFYNSGPDIVWSNPKFRSIPKDLQDVKEAAFTGDKGKHPICLISKSLSEIVNSIEERNLTLIYKLADKIL